MRFEDHFSAQAKTYAQYRPGYPPELFAYLASVAPAHELAWDCGTGNGQAAVALADHFERVVATDASAEQIAQAVPRERIEYRVEPAEQVNLPAGSVDLVTVALAVHWFDLDRFYQEVRRVLKPAGVLAVWTYHLPEITPAVDHILQAYYSEVLAGYWPEQLRYIDDRYRSLPFPFNEIKPPGFEMKADWQLEQLLGFLDSWSATRRYLDEKGHHPLTVIWQELAHAWGRPEQKRLVLWPLYVRAGRAT
jgi:SAM-dependent methyltransferase